jgi:hypothetical protein
MKKNYILVQGFTAKHLCNTVDALLAKGWQLSGSHQVTLTEARTEDKPAVLMYSQAMILDRDFGTADKPLEEFMIEKEQANIFPEPPKSE